MGGNVDYTGGMVLQSLLREATWVAVQPRSDDTIRILNPEAANFGWRTACELRTSEISDVSGIRLLCNRSSDSQWLAYVLGALHYLDSRSRRSGGGINLLIASDVPPNRGVSSSAALEIAVLKAVSLARDIPLSGVALAAAGQWVENVAVGAACGVMDQAAIVLGKKNRLLPMLCQPCRPFEPISIPQDLCIVGIDSFASRSTMSTTYDVARTAAFIGYKLVCLHDELEINFDEESPIPRWTESRWNGYLSNLTPSNFHASYERWLPESLTGREAIARIGEHVDPFTHIDLDLEYPVRAAVRYAAEENHRVQTARALLEESAGGISDTTLHTLGEIFSESHAAYAECGLGSEACDDLMMRIRAAGLAGAKMTGGGGGGVIAAICRPDQLSVVRQVAQDYSGCRGAAPRLFEGSSDGVDAFGEITSPKASPAYGQPRSE